MKNQILRSFQEEMGRRIDLEIRLTTVILDIIEKVYWRKDGPLEQSSYDDDVLNQKLDAADKKDFKEWVRHLIDTSANDDVIGGLIFAYGKMSDESDIPFISNYLERYYKKIERANGPFSQCYSILNNYGKTKTNKGSWSFDDYSWNMKNARVYLSTIDGNTV
jgi:hypothetical protein